MTAALGSPCNYALADALPTLSSQHAEPHAGHWAALIDTGQIQGLLPRLQRRFGETRLIQLYQNTFAEGALALSPVLIGLSPEEQQRSTEALWLDDQCKSHPVLSWVCTTRPLHEWAQHLRRFLRVYLEGTPYLWRLADVHMLQAMLQTLTPSQRAVFMQPHSAWWVISENGEPCNLRELDMMGNTQPMEPEQVLRLDAQQTHQLMQACTHTMLASQLRQMEPEFATTMGHAQQIQFARHCLTQARLDCVDEESELLGLAIQTWRAWAHEAASST